MKLSEIRKSFLDFFSENNHEIVDSSNLVPTGDDSILFTNAGMVQFKDVFLGLEKRKSSATTSQKCLRVGGKHNDLENVGFTTRHQTYFEMLGNFSFGDYFKEDAIKFAWEYLTVNLKIPKEKLIITVHETDEESEKIWLEVIGIEQSKIFRLGDEDNFWSMGDTGPCGPCSEIFFDYGDSYSGNLPDKGDTGDRYVEIWNLVFMEFNRDSSGKLSSLPNKCVDTGMGLERICSVLQNVGSNFEIDVFKSLKNSIKDKFSEPNDQSLNVVADHLRAAFFLIAEDVLPTNEGRGYVLRRIIRRAVRHGYKMGIREPFLCNCLSELDSAIGKDFSDEFKRIDFVQKILRDEETLFFKTLSSGMKIFEKIIQKNSKEIPGDIAFKLHDTYGFPIDLTRSMAEEQGLKVDENNFSKLMAKQKSGSKDSTMFNAKDIVLDPTIKSKFVGYKEEICTSNIIALFDIEGNKVDSLDSHGFGIFSETPFYAESGGQVSDIGSILNDDTEMKVIDCKKIGSIHLHEIIVEKGSCNLGQSFKLIIDKVRREKINCNHSATHLMHSALRAILGESVFQKGSLVNDEKLRFDFSHPKKLSGEEINKVEAIVNQEIEKATKTSTNLMSYDDAIKSGALAFFGDKYGDEVRVVSIGGDFSVELCGGTHVKNTSEIEGFIISNETSVSSGVRRVEAMTGSQLLKKSKEALNTIKEMSEILNVPQEDLVKRVTDVLKENKTLKSGKKAEKSLSSEELHASEIPTKHGKALVKLYKDASTEMLRRFSDKSKKDVEFCFSVFISIVDEKLSYIIAANVEKGFSAKDIIKQVNSCFDGSGGGRDEFAQGGSQEISELDARFEKLVELLNK